MVTQLVMKFPAINGTWRYITVFITAPTGSCPKPEESDPHFLIQFFLKSILILSTIAKK